MNDLYVFKEYPFMLVTNTIGDVSLWVIPPGISRALCLCHWKDKDESGHESVIHSFDIGESLHLIYIANEKGVIKALSYTSILMELGIEDSSCASKDLFNKLNGIFFNVL